MTMNKVDPGASFSLSFAGCGFLGLYHLGVASCLREYVPISRNTRICGSSAGALAAMALACDIPLGKFHFLYLFVYKFFNYFKTSN